MKKTAIVLTTAMVLVLSVASLPGQSHEQARKNAAAEAKQAHKADKTQAKADKKERKALNSSAVKDAARAQDKADAEAAKAPKR